MLLADTWSGQFHLLFFCYQHGVVVGVHHMTCSGWLCVLPWCCVGMAYAFLDENGRPEWVELQRQYILLMTGQPTPNVSSFSLRIAGFYCGKAMGFHRPLSFWIMESGLHLESLTGRIDPWGKLIWNPLDFQTIGGVPVSLLVDWVEGNYL